MVATKALDLKGAKLNLQSPEERDKSLQLTAVILFANPSHQTVLNFRKTLVMDEILDASAELCFIKRLFTVKQPAKVSTLWHHRRWLLQYQINRKGVLSYGDDDQFERTRIPADVLGGEFLLATSSSSIYPRNYHAWLHRTLCMRCALDQARTSNEHLDLLVEDRVTTMKWIDLHVSDYSAIHYFVNLSVGLDGLELLRGDRKRCLANEVQDHAQDLLARYPSHESIWMYNRLLEDSPLKKYLPPQTASEEMMVADRMEQRMSCEELCIDERIYRSHVRHHLAWKASRVRHLRGWLYGVILILISLISEGRHTP